MNERFLADVARNPNNAAILERWNELQLPDAWLVAGCLFQTVWNLQQGQPPQAQISDHDLFYFDAADVSAEGEAAVQARINALFKDLSAPVEAVNQARVHLWYERHFGHPYAPLADACEGIRRFLVLETCVGVRPGQVFAPNGLQCIYDGTLSLNPHTPSPALFAAKAASYRQRWPGLRTLA